MLRQGGRAARCFWAAVPRFTVPHGDVRPCGHFCTRTGSRVKQDRFLRFLESKITMRGGPLSVSEFMQDALTSPHGGYYMDHDVFGRSGDFVTSPEISQMFGEMVGAWVVYTWMQMSQPRKLNLVELGPGRGTLMTDILRSTAKFKAFASAVDVHMVEVSPALKSLQWSKLGCRPSSNDSSVGSSGSNSSTDSSSSSFGRNSTSSSDTSSGGASRSSSSSSSSGHARPSGIILPPSAQVPRNSNQQEALEGPSVGAGRPSEEGGSQDQLPSSSQGELPAQGLSRFNGTQVTWHVSLSTVPQEQPAIYIAHEFFDALPVHQFVKDERRGWVEKMVDTAELNSRPSASGGQNQPEVAQQQQQQQQQQQEHHEQQEQLLQSGDDSPPALRFVLSPGSTPASALLVPIRTKGMDPAQARACKELEVSAYGMATAEALAVRVGRHGGAALIMDYGRDAPYGDSLMAIRDHKGVEVLDRPGSADLSTWVDFGALRQGAQESGAPVCVHGPVSQASFLMQLGIQARLEKLLQAATPAQAEQLITGYKRLVGGSSGTDSSSSNNDKEGTLGSRKTDDQGHDSGMGQSYQVMAITSKGLEGPAAGFEGGKVVEVEESDRVLTNIQRL